MDKSVSEEDKIVEAKGIKFAISKEVSNYAKSFYIDYQRGIFGGGFRVFAGNGNSGSCC